MRQTAHNIPDEKPFLTSIHCLDGRIQEPLFRYLRETFNVQYVDAITEPGPCRILAEGTDPAAVESIHKRVRISLEKHGSQTIVISGHHDCAGNPVDRAVQVQQLERCERILREKYPAALIVKVWINDRWDVEEI